ncbi:MAG: hypothetical protein NXH95_16945 [Pseudomonadaceae bacterium]|nr:hypothetical protein [Pseudomonadaceae bacterium]
MKKVTSSHTAVSRYLNGYAESIAPDPPGQCYEFALIVPMFDEQPDALAQLLQHNAHLNILLIAVINAPQKASCDELERTRSLLQTVQSLCPVDYWLIDAVSQPLPTRQAVGLARKMGNDAACFLWTAGQLASPWLYQCDADSVLPANYFSTALPDRGAVVFAHHHTSDDPLLQKAAALYEQHMHHYVRGLQQAGSPYAYPTLGSTMAIHIQDYALVRGFPKRSAAEDFYLLNKIAKISQVICKPEVTVNVQARLSQRVPFGTGPALEKIIQGLEHDPSGAFYETYHPDSFKLLSNALQTLQAIAAGGEPADDRAGDLLRALGIKELLPKLRSKYPTAEQRTVVLTQWFDAGKTLRFIHLARKYHADISLSEVTANPEWAYGL